MIWTIIGIILLMWLLGFSFDVGGDLVHILLVIALIVLIVRIFIDRRSV